MIRRETEVTLEDAPATWNDRERIVEHRALSPAERLRRTIAVSRVTLRFADGARDRD